MEARDVVIVGYGRSGCARARKGTMAKMHPIEYGAQVLNGVLARVPGLKAEEVEDVITGCAMQMRETSMNVSQLIVNRAGWPDVVSGMSINRFCSSGLQAVALAANAIAMGQGDCYFAGGVEAMSLTFNVFPSYQGACTDRWLDKNYPGAYMSMGQTAENVAHAYGITREMMDQMAVDSHAKAAAAQKAGKLAPSIIPVKVTDYDGNPVLDENGNEIWCTQDEGIREGTSLESLAKLKTCFVPEEEGGLVTAGTSSQTNDCAAYVCLMSAEMAARKGIKPIARLKSFAVAGCDATMMGLGPMYATPKAMERAGMTVDQMDTIEINEAFASQSLVCIDKLGMDMSKVNPYGGAMALGHPLGCTGAILIGKALDRLREIDGKYALVTMCIGGGMGAAGILERCDEDAGQHY
ncbi:MAG: thiolase family protein [Oscillospiraceae bacterium]|nr:thiolase family protein [Oscillospiraceae bacterium]